MNDLQSVEYKCLECGRRGRPNELDDGSFSCPTCSYGSGSSYRLIEDFALVRMKTVKGIVERAFTDSKDEHVDNSDKAYAMKVLRRKIMYRLDKQGDGFHE